MCCKICRYSSLRKNALSRADILSKGKGITGLSICIMSVSWLRREKRRSIFTNSMSLGKCILYTYVCDVMNMYVDWR